MKCVSLLVVLVNKSGKDLDTTQTLFFLSPISRPLYKRTENLT